MPCCWILWNFGDVTNLSRLFRTHVRVSDKNLGKFRNIAKCSRGSRILWRYLLLHIQIPKNFMKSESKRVQNWNAVLHNFLMVFNGERTQKTGQEGWKFLFAIPINFGYQLQINSCCFKTHTFTHKIYLLMRGPPRVHLTKNVHFSIKHVHNWINSLLFFWKNNLRKKQREKR